MKITRMKAKQINKYRQKRCFSRIAIAAIKIMDNRTCLSTTITWYTFGSHSIKNKFIEMDVRLQKWYVNVILPTGPRYRLDIFKTKLTVCSPCYSSILWQQYGSTWETRYPTGISSTTLYHERRREWCIHKGTYNTNQGNQHWKRTAYQ